MGDDTQANDDSNHKQKKLDDLEDALLTIKPLLVERWHCLKQKQRAEEHGNRQIKPPPDRRRLARRARRGGQIYCLIHTGLRRCTIE